MLTLISLSVLCAIAVAVISVVLAIIGLPFVLLFGLLPWLLRVAGVVLAIKAAMEKPLRWESFVPAGIAFLLAWVL